MNPSQCRSHIILYSDGGASPNPGRGGWAAILSHNGREMEISGSALETTNNVMELTAVCEGLKALKQPARVTVVTDSQNVIGWLSLGWKRRDAHVREVCSEIERIAQQGGHVLFFEKVRGHTGHTFNERCHTLVEKARNKETFSPEAMNPC